MTPQERQLVRELFDRLARLEGQPRDPDAERLIADGFDHAPNAAYPLVQTVLVQEEALKRANARIEELEAALDQGGPHAEPTGGFLDTVRNTMLGREPQRGSVPSVRTGSGPGTGGVWNTGARPDPRGRTEADTQYAAAPPAFGGGSFLGTAAASAAGMIGGALLLNSIRSMFGGPSSAPGSNAAFDSGLGGGSPWGRGDASGSGLARDAGVGDIGSSRSAAFDDDTRRTGLFDDDGDFSRDDDAGVDDDFAADFDGDVDDSDFA